MARPRRMSDRSAQAGFTLIELMIVVSIIAVVAALAAPSIGAAVRDRKASTATLDVVRTFRGARGAAAGYGRAYLVRYDQDADDGQGGLTVFRGTTNRCNSAAFTQAVPDLAYAAPRHVLSSDFEIVLDGPADDLDLCYEPTGVTWWRTTSSGRFSDGGFGEGEISGFRFTIDRQVDGASEGAVMRHVVVPLGGDARVAR